MTRLWRLLANQLQRHSAAQGVALRVKTDPFSFRAFAEMVADKDVYLARLERAKADPTSPEAMTSLMFSQRVIGALGRGARGQDWKRAAFFLRQRRHPRRS